MESHDESDQSDERLEKILPDWRTMQGMASGPGSLTKALEEEHREELAREDARLQRFMTQSLRARHEIPNPQVLDAARQFRDAFELLILQPPGSGVLLPALHCAAIGLELYLKALSARELEGPLADPRLRGKYIYAKSPSNSHKLESLFDDAPADIQDLINQRAAPVLNRFCSVRKMLEGYNPMLQASRYPFEPNRDLKRCRYRGAQ